MIDMKDVSLVRQDVEKYTSLVLLYEGVAKQLLPEFVGDIRLSFPATELKAKQSIRFDWVSSVLFCDEMLWTKHSYPYFKDVAGKSGLFLVNGSSYLGRISDYFPNHFHYIYFDAEFNWHITARGIEELDG